MIQMIPLDFCVFQTPESGAWRQAIPSPNISTFLDSQNIPVSVALRLGCLICPPNVSKCGAVVDGLK